MVLGISSLVAFHDSSALGSSVPPKLSADKGFWDLARFKRNMSLMYAMDEYIYQLGARCISNINSLNCLINNQE